jgi:soluble lytic murein transglycosylase-like protein
VKAIIKAESNFNHRAVSPKGAKGLMQLMPATASSLQVRDSFHPENNIEGGVKYVRYLLNFFNGNLPLALAAYNAGENAVLRYGGIPPYRETQTYVRRVLSYHDRFK